MSMQTFQVFPTIPESLSFLETLVRNLWWSWKPDAKDLFRRIDPKLWSESGRNPVVFLTRLPQERLEQLAVDDSYLAHLKRVEGHFAERVLSSVDRQDPYRDGETIAYFSMEFGIHESIPLFAGGLGVLAGDHLKASSNMGLPLTGIGLLYREGYFRQFLDTDGWQQEEYPQTDLYQLPLERARDPEGNDLRVSVTGPDGPIHADVWKLVVGRIPLYLLDANILQNGPIVRDITARLYSGDARIRLSQEVLLGIGGMQALTKMGILPKVVHMNEGHSAFSSIERVAQTMERVGVDLKTALEIVPRSTIFTTHTPVAAGHDEFPADLVKPVLKVFAPRLGTTVEEILSWGQPTATAADGPMSMFVLGLRMAGHCNGVSELHGQVARNMWSHVWPKRPVEEVPISHVTNGIHVSTFISDEFARLFDRYLGPEWYMSSRKPENIRRINDIYEEDLWRAHEMNRSRLIRYCRELMARQYARRNAPRAAIEEAESVLDPEVLTIAFARRFATYKRAYLLLQDKDRLDALLTSKEQPVQFIFAGKAHPRDNEGKELIQRIVRFARQADIRHRFIFLENYDMAMARYLVQGADVWLNNPRRPFEACGTSGMKAAVNGVLNLSILDGWWCEGYSEEVGWAIGRGEEYPDTAYQDAVESQALYNVLENGVIPTFYDRKNGDAPNRWIRMMKASMKMAMRDFCSLRMVADYYNRYYVPAGRRFDELLAEDAGEARQIASQVKRFRSFWNHVQIDPPVREMRGSYRVGDELRIITRVKLGELRPEEVVVELYYGLLKSVDSIREGRTQTMTMSKDLGDGSYEYACSITCTSAGRYGFTARVTPQGDRRVRTTPLMVAWA
ncbi:MAG: alpha-glucan family phosphorylase [Desulfobacterales bacterium]|jgi:starch phosphorylase